MKAQPVAWHVIAKGGKFTRGIYENPTSDDFELWILDGDTARPLIYGDAAPPAPEGMVPPDYAKAMDYLATMFDLYENGVPCTEDGEDGASIGNCIKLDEADFDSIADLLNKHRPVPGPIHLRARGRKE